MMLTIDDAKRQVMPKVRHVKGVGMLLGLFFLSVEVALAKEDQIGSVTIDCERCMPGNACDPPRLPRSAVIAEVSGARFRGYDIAGCPQFGDELCSRFFSSSFYSFDQMSFSRNDFNADERTKFEVNYSFPTNAPEQWSGIYLHGDRRYLIVATESGLSGAPTIVFACERSSSAGENK